MGMNGLRTRSGYQPKPITDASMSAVINRIQNESKQEAHIFDSSGNEIAAYQGGKRGVYVNKDALRYAEGGTLVYNHAGKYDYGGTISPSAMKIFAKSGLKEMRVVSPDGRQFALRFKSNTTPQQRQKLASKASSLSKLLKRNYQRSYKSQLARFKNQGYSTAKARELARQKALGMYDRSWKKIAGSEVYGLEYIKMK